MVSTFLNVFPLDIVVQKNTALKIEEVIVDN